MVFKVTINIEWNGWGQPLGSMVFRWFWGKTTIGNNGFQWLCTNCPTMEWLCTIVEVLHVQITLILQGHVNDWCSTWCQKLIGSDGSLGEVKYTLQGLSERMSKVKCLWKSQFSQKISFLNCFRSEISGKFMPYSIQVHQNHPEAPLEAGASGVLSDSGWLAQADYWPEILSKGPNHVLKFPRGKISNINIFFFKFSFTF